MKKRFLTILVLAVLLFPAAVSAGDTPCVGALTGTFDNVVVPSGATCTLGPGASVEGNVKALEDSRLFIIDSGIGGNVQGDKASAVEIFGTEVDGNVEIIEGHDLVVASAVVFNSSVSGGNIQIEKGRFPFGDWVVINTEVVEGNVKVEENSTIFGSAVFDSLVAQNVQVFKNTGPAFKGVQGNTVGEDLQCKENEAPFVGGPNTAGKAEDQCF